MDITTVLWQTYVNIVRKSKINYLKKNQTWIKSYLSDFGNTHKYLSFWPGVKWHFRLQTPPNFLQLLLKLPLIWMCFFCPVPSLCPPLCRIMSFPSGLMSERCRLSLVLLSGREAQVWRRSLSRDKNSTLRVFAVCMNHFSLSETMLQFHCYSCLIWLFLNLFVCKCRCKYVMMMMTFLWHCFIGFLWCLFSYRKCLIPSLLHWSITLFVLDGSNTML